MRRPGATSVELPIYSSEFATGEDGQSRRPQSRRTPARDASECPTHVTVIGEPTVVGDLRQWRRGAEYRRGCALHQLKREVISRRHAIRLPKLAREMYWMDIHRLSESRNGWSCIDVVE